MGVLVLAEGLVVVLVGSMSWTSVEVGLTSFDITFTANLSPSKHSPPSV